LIYEDLEDVDFGRGFMENGVPTGVSGAGVDIYDLGDPGASCICRVMLNKVR
jgi:hypothetical protein